MSYNKGTGAYGRDNIELKPRDAVLRPEYDLGKNTPLPMNLLMLADYLSSIEGLMGKLLNPRCSEDDRIHAAAAINHMRTWIAFVRGLQDRMDIINDTAPPEPQPNPTPGWPAGKKRK